jgi:hypothetical protein
MRCLVEIYAEKEEENATGMLCRRRKSSSPLKMERNRRFRLAHSEASKRAIEQLEALRRPSHNIASKMQKVRCRGKRSLPNSDFRSV